MDVVSFPLKLETNWKRPQLKLQTEGGLYAVQVESTPYLTGYWEVLWQIMERLSYFRVMQSKSTQFQRIPQEFVKNSSPS